MKLYDTSLKYMDAINAIGGTIVAVLTAALGTHWFLFVGFLVKTSSTTSQELESLD